MRDFAERLIVHEMRATPETKIPAACLVSEKLRPHLATLIGLFGFRALLSRALALANTEVRWLRAVRVNANASFEGFDQLGAQVGPKEIFAGCVVLLAEFLGLLVAFIGEDLTLRLMREAWPKLRLDSLDAGKGIKK
jgi:hypothetical protein